VSAPGVALSRVPPSWRFRRALAPALRRAAFVAVPVGASVLGLLLVRDEYAAGLATAALVAGFVAFDAPARVRVRWQLLTAPLIGASACLGVLSSQSTITAVAAMAMLAAMAGLCVAVSARLMIAGLACSLALLIAQGFYLEPADALPALVLGTAGGLLQAIWASVAWAFADRGPGRWKFRQAAHDGVEKLRANLSLRSTAMRHAIRFGAALGAGVAIYRVVDIGEHGYWIPLTILFVLRPAQDETLERLAMRAAGTVLGLGFATGLAVILGEQALVTAIVLTVAAAFTYALLAIEYALFTTAITIYVVLLTDALGTKPIDAADERALATAIGIAVAGLAFWIWGEAEE
jgi:hypothetical protein